VTGAYSHTDYVASFVGFAPVNHPAVTVVVILDSAVGLHQGGQIAAPVFQRVAQQTLAYLNVPHDTELKPRPLQMARVKDSELSESSPDRLGGAPEVAAPAIGAQPAPAEAAQASLLPASGTVVLDVEGGVVVPSFLGRPVRAAIELSQDSGVEIDIIGNGVAREQAPPPGARIPEGARVAVRFAR
jgi:cell division protein FtsI (penicillin-binding protein 3)